MANNHRGKRNNRRRSRRSSGSSRNIAGVDRTVTITGKVLFPVTTSTGNSSTMALNPSAVDAARLTQLGQSFELFRFTNLKLRMYPATADTGSTRVSMIMAYDRLDATPPAGIDVAYVAPVSRYVDEFITVPVSMNINRQDLLHAQTNWWSTHVDAGSENNPLINCLDQGFVHWVAATTGAETVVEIAYTVQFRSATTSVDDLSKSLQSSRLNRPVSNVAAVLPGRRK